MRRKHFSIVLTFLCVLTLAFGFTACGEKKPTHTHSYTWVNNGDGTHKQHCANDGCDAADVNAGSHDFSNGNCVCGEVKHTHAYMNEVATEDFLKSAATCTDKAVYYKSCECGEKDMETFEYGELLPHTGGTATCTDKAICTECEQEYGQLLPHAYTKEVASEGFIKTEATCTAKAVYYKSCECGARNEETFEYGEFAAHKYGAWVEEVAATCNATGTKGHKDCDACKKHFDKDGNEILELTIAKDLSTHKFGEWQIVTPADCENDGEKKRVCSVCTEEESVKIDTINHDWAEPTYEWAEDYSSCTATRACKNDSAHVETETATAELQTAVQATETSFGEGNYIVNFKNAAFTAATSPKFDVSVDGVAYQPQEEYQWEDGSGDDYSCTVTKVCVSDPTKTITETAKITLEILEDSTCMKEGLGRYVAKFTNPAFETQYSENVVLPIGPHYIMQGKLGSDENGHWNICDNECGEKLNFEEHTAGEWEITKDPTFTYEGEQVKKCVTCTYVLETEILPKLSNDWDGSSVAGSFEGGSGSTSNPYLIKTGAQLKYLADLINSGTKGYSTCSYKLVDDIDLGGNEWEPIGCLYVSSLSDYSMDRVFGGTFDGDGYIVSNFKITRLTKDFYQYFGLFARVQGGTIKDLGVENFNINIKQSKDGASVFIGGLAGMMFGGCTVTNCYTANGTVATQEGTYGYINAGGFAGAIHQSKINYCFSAANVSVIGYSTQAGGFVGEIYSSSSLESKKTQVSYVLAIGNVSADAYGNSAAVGGLYGDYSFATVSYNYIYDSQVITRKGNPFKPTDAIKRDAATLNSASFYTDTLKFSESVWDLTNLDIANGRLPRLKVGV